MWTHSDKEKYHHEESVGFALLGCGQRQNLERCEWARTLKANGMDGYYGISLADCEYQHVSLGKCKIILNLYIVTNAMLRVRSWLPICGIFTYLLFNNIGAQRVQLTDLSSNLCNLSF